jgi:hypothetical protein
LENHWFPAIFGVTIFAGRRLRSPVFAQNWDQIRGPYIADRPAGEQSEAQE